jgi:hypothetical protein
MKRWAFRVLGVVIACLALAAELLYADDLVLRRELHNLYPKWIQNCVVGAEETELECEGRWLKALEP